MHQAKIIACVEGMRSHGADSAFGRQARMTDDVGALHLLDGEGFEDIGRQPDLLVDLKGRARAQYPDAIAVLVEPATRVGRGWRAQIRVGGIALDRNIGVESRTSALCQRIPIIARLRAIDRYLRDPVFAAAIDADPGA